MLIDIFKLSFTKEVKGIIHIGAHDCKERIDYLTRFNNITDDEILWIDSLENKVNSIKQKYPSVKIFNEFISDKDNEVISFNITNNYQSSSILNLKEYLHADIDKKTKTLKTFYNENNLNYNQFNFINFDIQGTQLLGLIGAGDILNTVDYIYIGVNNRELNQKADDIDSYLSTFNFVRKNILITDHGLGHAFYVKEIFHISNNFKVMYGTDLIKIDITELVLNTNANKNNIIYIPSGDADRASIYGDPVYGQLKNIYIESDTDSYIIDHTDQIYIDKNKNTLSFNFIKNNTINYELCIMAIFKNESLNLKIWIEHYLWQGVDHFYLIDNGSTDEPLKILQYYIDKGLVSYFFRPEKYKQAEHYRNIFDENNLKEKTKWLIICDVDEFFFGNEKKLITTLIDFDNYDVINTNSFFYGPDDNIEHPEDIRISNIYRNSDTINGNKYIFKPRIIKDSSEIWIHWLVIPNTLQKQTFKNEIYENTKIRLNHYQIQSVYFYEKIKMTRGDVSRVENEHIRTKEVFENYKKECTIKDDILKNLVENDYNYFNTALIVEPRFLKHLPFVINDFNKKLGARWKTVFYCGKDFKKIWIELLDKNIEIRELKQNFDTYYDYCDVLKNKDLWTSLYGNYVLVFTADSYIINKPPYTIDYFMSLNKSYIGGNQFYKWNELVRENIDFNYYNFQGGLSLRNRLDIITIIDTFRTEKTIEDCSRSQRLQTDAEDVYFTIGCYKLGLSVGDDEECSHFSAHTKLIDGFFGANRLEPGYYLNLIEQYDDICNNIYLYKGIQNIDNERLVVHPGNGFFSNCTVRLLDIILYFNSTKKVPLFVDSSQQFDLYKMNRKREDITQEYFEENLDYDIEYIQSINFKTSYQYINYNKLNFTDITPFIKKYFSPTKNILDTVIFLETKYNIENYNDICVLFYRGNDKVTEVELPSYDDYVIKARKLYDENNNIKFLIQSDEREFIERMEYEFPNNSFYFKDEIRVINKSNKLSVDKINPETNFSYSQYYLAITIIMSKCNYIICNTGNCSLWIALFRGNAENVYQVDKIKNEQNNNSKICFITANYGRYEKTCKKYVNQTVPTDFICFTDNKNITSNGWIIDTTPYHLINKSPLDNGSYINSINNNNHTFNIAKYYKQSFQNIPKLKKYDVVVWIDGTIEITNEKTSEYILDNIYKYKIIGWHNYDRNGILKNEVIGSLKCGRYLTTFWRGQNQPYQDVEKQYNTYLINGYDEKYFKDLNISNDRDFGVWLTCFVAFLNIDTEITNFLNLWYLQTLTHTTQDQIGFSYVCQKTAIIPYTLPNNEIHGEKPHFNTSFYNKYNHGE